MKKLEVGKDYICVHNNSMIVIDRKGNCGNNGFLYKEYKDNLLCITPEIWREATKEEGYRSFSKALSSSLWQDWETMKIKEKTSLFIFRNK